MLLSSNDTKRRDTSNWNEPDEKTQAECAWRAQTGRRKADAIVSSWLEKDKKVFQHRIESLEGEIRSKEGFARALEKLSYPSFDNYDVRLIPDTQTAALPETGVSQVFIGQSRGHLHLRIFDHLGTKIVDKQSDTFEDGPRHQALRDALKILSPYQPLPPRICHELVRHASFISGCNVPDPLSLDELAREIDDCSAKQDRKGNWMAAWACVVMIIILLVAGMSLWNLKTLLEIQVPQNNIVETEFIKLLGKENVNDQAKKDMTNAVILGLKEYESAKAGTLTAEVVTYALLEITTLAALMWLVYLCAKYANGQWQSAFYVKERVRMAKLVKVHLLTENFQGASHVLEQLGLPDSYDRDKSHRQE